MRNNSTDNNSLKKARRTVKKYQSKNPGTGAIVSTIRKTKSDTLSNDNEPITDLLNSDESIPDETSSLTDYQMDTCLSIAAYIIESTMRLKRQPDNKEIAAHFGYSVRSIQLYKKHLQNWRGFMPVLRQLSVQILTMYGTRIAFKGNAADIKAWFQIVENVNFQDGVINNNLNVNVSQQTNVASFIATNPDIEQNERDYWTNFYNNQTPPKTITNGHVNGLVNGKTK